MYAFLSIKIEKKNIKKIVKVFFRIMANVFTIFDAIELDYLCNLYIFSWTSNKYNQLRNFIKQNKKGYWSKIRKGQPQYISFKML